MGEREYWRPLGDPKLLRRYERARAADVAAMQWLTDGLFDLFGHTDPPVEQLRHWGLQAVNRFTPVRDWLLELPPRPDAQLERRQEWHYEQAVYREQVQGQPADSARLLWLRPQFHPPLGSPWLWIHPRDPLGLVAAPRPR